MAARDTSANVNAGQRAPNGVNPYSGAGGKVRSSRVSSKKRKPYDRPVPAPISGHQSSLESASTGLVDSATRFISSSASYLFSSIFKRSKTLTIGNGGRPSAASDVGKFERKQDHPGAATTGNNFRSPNLTAKSGGNHSKSPKLAPRNGGSHGKDLDLAQVESRLKHKHLSREQVERLTEVLQAQLNEENVSKVHPQNGESSKAVPYQLNPVDLARAYMEEQTGKTIQSPSVLATPSQYLVAPSSVVGSRVLFDGYGPSSRMSGTPATVACTTRISKRRYNADEDDDLSSLRMAKRRLIAYEDDDIVFRGPPRRVRQKMAMVMRSPYLRQVNAMSRSSRASLTPMIQSKRSVEMSHEIIETPMQSLKGKTVDDSEGVLLSCNQAEAPESSKSRDIVQKLENNKEDTHLAIEFLVASETPIPKPAVPAEEKTSNAAVVPSESICEDNSKSEGELPKKSVPEKSKGFRMSAIFEDSYSDDEQERETVSAVQAKESKTTVTSKVDKCDNVLLPPSSTKQLSQAASPEPKLSPKVVQSSHDEPHSSQSVSHIQFPDSLVSAVVKDDPSVTENRAAFRNDTLAPSSTALFSSGSNGTALPPLPKASPPVTESVFPALLSRSNENLFQHVVKVDHATATKFTEATAATQTYHKANEIQSSNSLTAPSLTVAAPEPVSVPASTVVSAPAPIMLFNAAPVENKTEEVMIEPDSMAMETMSEDPTSSNVASSVSAIPLGTGPLAGSSFGSQPGTSTTDGCSLGVAPSESSAPAAFTFGGQPSTTPATQPFTFGNSAPATQSAFTFGSSDSIPAASASQPSFAFGASGSSAQPTSSASPSPFAFGSLTSAPTAPVPSFGNTSTAPTSQPAFSFSASPATSGTAPFAFGSNAGTTSSSQTFPFGGQASSTPSNPFGGQSTSAPSNPFGGQATTTENPFGGQPTSTTPSPFGAQPTSTAASPFGAQSSPFGAQPTSTAASPFGAQPTSTATSPFGAQPTTETASPFGGQPTSAPANPFGGQPTLTASTPFGGQPASNSAPSTFAFGGQPVAPSSSPAPSTFTFGGQPGAPSSSPAPSTFTFGGQPGASPSPFAFGNQPAAPSFGFGGQPNPAAQSSFASLVAPTQSAFAPPGAQASDFGGGFALGAASGGGDKAGRKFIKAKRVGAAKRK